MAGYRLSQLTGVFLPAPITLPGMPRKNVLRSTSMKNVATLAGIFAFLSLVTNCAGGGGEDSSSDFGAVSFDRETVVEQANFPTSLVSVADGRIFYAEFARGDIRVVRSGTLATQVVAHLDVLGTGNEGLLGLAADPHFGENGLLYAYFTSRSSKRNQVVRLHIQENRTDQSTVILDNLPSGGHDGGRLAFAADGTLFISVGDAGNPALAQDRSSLAGKILRVHSDGTIPTDNPFPGSPVFALGLRNAYGLAVDPRSGALYASDNGPSCDDEINRVPRGGNLGWRPAQPCSDSDEGYTRPLLTFTPPIAPTGIAFYHGDTFPPLEGNLLMGDFLNGHLTRFEVDKDSGAILRTESLLTGELGAILDVAIGSEGYVYIATTTAISRLVPKHLGQA